VEESVGWELVMRLKSGWWFDLSLLLSRVVVRVDGGRIL